MPRLLVYAVATALRLASAAPLEGQAALAHDRMPAVALETASTWTERVVAASGTAPAESLYIVVDVARKRLVLTDGTDIRFEAPVATGMRPSSAYGAAVPQFATPRGRMVVSKKEEHPRWVPPGWHYREVARRTGRRLQALERGDTVRAADGAAYFVLGTAILRRDPQGRTTGVPVAAGDELVVDGRIIVPPVGTAQRSYPDVLGTRRLVLADGFAIHGTNKPSSIGKAASHGCVRMRNADIEALYRLVPVGTPVYMI